VLAPGLDAAELSRLKRRFERERSARLQAEDIAERGLRELYEKKEQLELLGAIAVAANESTSIDDVLRFALATVCQSIGWSLGHAYATTRTGTVTRLTPTTLWHDPNNDRTQAFRRTTETTDFSMHDGLPGRVLASGEPAWIVDIAVDGNFPDME
jgi:hypothetical protein